ncbi:Bifunctional lycopene cyclase/phytoene synthase [Penicillium sp. IBT 18751x]|nr:Bifunctional lycopene cyclase/phytoene synthase [Penicillium sp. IBT 18751x]
MGYDYWLVHLTWTLPPAALLTAAYWPFFTKLEVTKILILINIAVFATIPWDSYLIRNRIWSYPADAILGHTLLDIPFEEIFFFIIQTYCTSLLYVVLTKHLVLPAYLLPRKGNFTKAIGTATLMAGTAMGIIFMSSKSHLTYLGLILAWALPVLTFQWLLCGNFLISLPKKPLLFSILLPTLYLWTVDFFSLQRGTWVIERGTKVDIRFGGSLDLEEAVFFLITNVMVVFGLVTVDHALAIAEYDTVMSKPADSRQPSVAQIFWSYMTSQSRSFDVRFLEGLNAAIEKLSQKSQSMYLGSAMFQDRLRIDLVLLYSFCRVIDDLVDEAPDRETAQANIKEASQVLHWRFSTKRPTKPLYDYLEVENSPEQTSSLSPLLSSIALLPVSRLTLTPLLELLSGFEMDLDFSIEKQAFPIATESDLQLYAHRVAGTVASSLLELVFSHYGMDQTKYDRAQQERIIKSGHSMGQALQYVNIARDITRDAAINRVYIPTSWLAEEGLTPNDVLASPHDDRLAIFEDRMLRKANDAYKQSVRAIDELPKEARGPIKTTIESYMMIGEMVRRRRRAGIKAEGKLKVPLWRRLRLAWWEMNAS